MTKSRKNTLSVIPIGGVSEIGKNMLVLECNDDIIVVDAGLKFPTEELPGVDLVIPNIAYLKSNKEKVGMNDIVNYFYRTAKGVLFVAYGKRCDYL